MYRGERAKKAMQRIKSLLKRYLPLYGITVAISYVSRVFLFEPSYMNRNMGIHLDDILDPGISTGYVFAINNTFSDPSKIKLLSILAITGRSIYEGLEWYLFYNLHQRITPYSYPTFGGTIKDILVFSLPILINLKTFLKFRKNFIEK